MDVARFDSRCSASAGRADYATGPAAGIWNVDACTLYCVEHMFEYVRETQRNPRIVANSDHVAGCGHAGPQP